MIKLFKEFKNKLNESDAPYWDSDTGKYAKEYSKLYDEFVPDSGCSKYVIGEFIRIVSRILYEYYNNGNINARDIQYEEECYDTEVWDDESQEYYTEEECEEVEGDCNISGYYESMLEFVEKHGPVGIKDIVNNVRDVICKYDNNYDFNESDNKPYTLLADTLIKHVIDNYNDKTEISKIDPYYYEMHNKN